MHPNIIIVFITNLNVL